MNQNITGIHHITAIAGDAQRNIDFYTGVLGLRLVKKTVNFDAPDVYHFYYGNETGDPGTILTFFPFGQSAQGRNGNGMLNTTTFSVPLTAFGYWEERLKKSGVSYNKAAKRFEGEIIISFDDPDGLKLELVFTEKDDRPGFTYGIIPLEHSIKGFYSTEIWEEEYEKTAALLTEELNHKLIIEKDNRYRFAASDAPGNYIDIISSPDKMKGYGGNGTVHHIAFSTPDGKSQMEVRDKIAQKMFNPTPVIDRQYFHSVYFREPGGVLFEIATAQPGFMIDENKDQLGDSLKLPPQYEKHRGEIEKILVPVSLNLKKDHAK